MDDDIDRYTFRISWSEDDKEHVGLCSEFPSLSWLAKSPAAALQGIRKLVGETVEEMREHGEEPPEPLSLHRFSGKLLIRIPPEVHRALTLEAAEQGISLNRLISAKLAEG